MRGPVGHGSGLAQLYQLSARAASEAASRRAGGYIFARTGWPPSTT